MGGWKGPSSAIFQLLWKVALLNCYGFEQLIYREAIRRDNLILGKLRLVIVQASQYCDLVLVSGRGSNCTRTLFAS